MMNNDAKQMITTRGFAKTMHALLIAGGVGLSTGAGAQPLSYINTVKVPDGLLKTDVVLSLPRTVYTAKFTCGIWADGKTFAQVNQGLGAAPPLSRDHEEPDVLPNKPQYYYDFQPGTYSTALNLFNPTLKPLSVAVQVSTESLSSPQVMATFNIASLDTAKVGCEELEKLLPASNKGALVEGFFHITRFATDLQVQAVYTYTSIAAFQEFRGGFVDDLGTIPGELLEYFPALAGAGAGAGGVGLGASVDIETIQPLQVK